MVFIVGVTVATLMGDNGILTKAEKAKLETRGGAVQEARDLWKAEINADEKINNETTKTLDEVLDELIFQNLITKEERKEIEETGQVTIGSRVIVFTEEFLISDIVKVGDFVNYTAGIWTQEEIDNLENLYTGKSLPKSAGEFGGFQVGDSKDETIDIQQYEGTKKNKYQFGWRVLSVDSESNIVELIHSGTPEAYYQGYNGSAGYQSYYILTGKNSNGQSYSGKYRNWKEYENLDFAIENSARLCTSSEMDEVDAPYLTFPGEGYWVPEVKGMGWSLECFIKLGTNYLIGNVCLGIRPVVTLRQDVKIEKPTSSNDGSTPDKAYILKK